MNDFRSPGVDVLGVDWGWKTGMPNASRNSLPSPVFGDGDDEVNRGGQSRVRDYLSPRRERTESKQVREKEKEAGPTSSEPRRIFR